MRAFERLNILTVCVFLKLFVRFLFFFFPDHVGLRINGSWWVMQIKILLGNSLISSVHFRKTSFVLCSTKNVRNELSMKANFPWVFLHPFLDEFTLLSWKKYGQISALTSQIIHCYHDSLWSVTWRSWGSILSFMLIHFTLLHWAGFLWKCSTE